MPCVRNCLWLSWLILLAGSGTPEAEVATPEPLPRWVTLPAVAEGEFVEVRRIVSLSEAPAAARLRLSARGTAVTVLVNDEPVCHLEEYGPEVALEVTSQLRAGENELRLRCRPSSDAAPRPVRCVTDARGSQSRVPLQ